MLHIYASVNWGALIQVMACRLFGPKKLLEPMLTYCQLTPGNTLQWNLNQNTKMFHSWKCIWKCCPRNGSHFAREGWFNMRIWSQQNKAQQNSVHIIWETLYIKVCWEHFYRFEIELINVPEVNKLTHWGLVMPYGDRDLDQHWFR